MIETPEWTALKRHVAEMDKVHLRELLDDAERNQGMVVEHDGVVLDYARQLVRSDTMDMLFDLAMACEVKGKLSAMCSGKKVNTTEDRAVLHTALRAARDEKVFVDGVNVVPDVWSVLDSIKAFTDKVRSGEWTGKTGKLITNFVSVGIGGSYLGGEFVAEALKTELRAEQASKGFQLRFLANVDPVAVQRATRDLDPETTMVIVISKTFTTAETMLNARTLREWIISSMGKNAVPKHMIAVSANTDAVAEFGIDPNNTFGFWDWVGGRYSVTSAVGMVPLALLFSFDVMESFLEGARSIDRHALHAPPRENLPMTLGLLGIWNVSFLKHPVHAVLPYSEAMVRFAAHLQQLSMESNGKRVGVNGNDLPYDCGEVVFGEPGTNGQHSFYQLIHQGRVIPADFIGFIRSQHPVNMEGETVSNHDELMSNFFAQPDALAVGKASEDLQQEGVASALIPHKTFPGNRPSSSILLPEVSAYTVGQLLSLYEHKTAIQGFVWGINSFDQWGVELGKALGKRVRNQIHESRTSKAPVSGFNSATTALMERYLSESSS